MTACPFRREIEQNMLLGPRSDMDQIAEAIRKIRAHAPALARA